MKDYLLIFRGGDARRKEMSQEQMQQHMQKWGEWMQSLSEKGQLKAGDPLEDDGNMLYKKDDGNIATDGPFPETKELVGGYLIISANDQEQANEISKECPIFEYNGTVEVRQIAPMEM